VDDNCTTYNIAFSSEFYHGIIERILGFPVLVRQNIAKIPYMSHLGVWPTMCGSEGVEMSASRRASVREITSFMNVETVFAVRFQTGYVNGYFHFGTFFYKAHGSFHGSF
jgi:hypothetical protein